jgi:hypothetical protein
MRDKFLTVISVLESLKNIDLSLNQFLVNKENINWDFATLKQKLADLSSIENQQYFNHFAIISGYKLSRINHLLNINKDKFNNLSLLTKKLQNEDNLTTDDIQNLLNNIEPMNQETLLFDLLANNITAIVNFAKIKHPDWFEDKEKVVELVSANGLLLNNVNPLFADNQEIVFAALSNNINFTATKYIGKN